MKYWYLFYNGDFDAMRWDDDILRFESEAEARSFAEVFGLEDVRIDQVDLDGFGMSYKDIPAWQFKEEIISRIENKMNI